ncbi:hypothetical protein R1flu_008563 [Riccia fluitans]|uniref:Uncharacterized protein n=1 Tax=Riccia fluitans TaxID=41844 RepID=A0ABD1YC99_9MARC
MQAEEVPAAETSAKLPKEKEVPATTKPVPDEDDPNAKAEPERRRSKQRQSSPKTLMDKPKSRKKMKMPKKDTIDLSNDEPQEAKKEEEIVLAEGTL